MKATIVAAVIVVSAATFIAGGPAPSDPPDAKQMHYYEFALHGMPATENFVAWTSDPFVISLAEQQLQLPPEERFLHINGSIAAGDGGHNQPWSWHFVPDEWSLAEISIEICDGTPSWVESDLEYWLTLGQFCPWSSYVAYEIVNDCCNHDGIRGDVNWDFAGPNIVDLTYFVAYLFAGGEWPPCNQEADVNGDDIVNIVDLTSLVAYLFEGGAPPEPCW